MVLHTKGRDFEIPTGYQTWRMMRDGSRHCLESRCTCDEQVGDRHDPFSAKIYAGMVLVVTHDFAKVKFRVRFPVPAPCF